MFSFSVEARSGRARAGRLVTPHGAVDTPGFMPVGTAGAGECVPTRGAAVVRPCDEGPPRPAAGEVAAAAPARPPRWPERGRGAHRRSDQWLFGIVQGGVDAELRERSAREIVALGFPGHAIGGLAVGEAKPDTMRVVAQMDGLLPEEKPRYLMGVGTPEDLLEAVARGIDLFDCVLPTRNARNGQLFTRHGRLSIRNARYRLDPHPPDPGCARPPCAGTSRAYLRHLPLARES